MPEVEHRVIHIEADDEIAEHVLVRLLDDGGSSFTVDRTPDRESGLRALLDTESFDLAVVNLDNPDSGGTEIVDDILVHAPGTAVVVYSADPPEGSEQACLRTGASEFLNTTELLTIDLRRVFERAIDRKHFERQIRELATTDDLTGVGNRRALQRQHRTAADKLARQGGALLVGIIDLDDFKRINDEHGHVVGDEVLRSVASRLSNALRSEDGCARFGGDEFAVVAHVSSERGLDAVRKRIRAVLDDPPIVVGDGETVRASVGFVASDLSTTPLPELLRRADVAMYADKRAARGR